MTVTLQTPAGRMIFANLKPAPTTVNVS